MFWFLLLLQLAPPVTIEPPKSGDIPAWLIWGFYTILTIAVGYLVNQLKEANLSKDKSIETMVKTLNEIINRDQTRHDKLHEEHAKDRAVFEETAKGIQGAIHESAKAYQQVANELDGLRDELKRKGGAKNEP